MDPFLILPEEICDEILSYLKVRDIKEASLVTKHWYTLIGRTKSCMKKLCLKPKNSHENLEFFESILGSTRIYQNLEMVDRYNDVKKNTKYFRLMRDVVTKFADTLVSLKISNDLIIKVDLPKLRQMNFCGLNYIATNGLLTKGNGLENLKVDCWSIDEKSLKYLRRFLMENDSLKVLNIKNRRVFEGLNSDNIKFKLDVFKPPRYLGPGELLDFMSAHKSTLKVTKCVLSTDCVTLLMSNFPQLHTLTLKCRGRIFDIPNYPFNATIKIVKLTVCPHEVHELGYSPHIVDFIQKLQNLQTIEIGYINSDILHALLNSRTLKTVKYSLKYRNLNVTGRELEEMELQENIEFIEI